MARHVLTRTLPLGALLVAAALGGCGKLNKSKYPVFDGVAFRTTAKPVHKKTTLADFRVVVHDALRAPDAAFKAGSHQARRYCIENYGTSDFSWSNVAAGGVEGSAALSLPTEGGDAVLFGSCTQ